MRPFGSVASLECLDGFPLKALAVCRYPPQLPEICTKTCRLPEPLGVWGFHPARKPQREAPTPGLRCPSPAHHLGSESGTRARLAWQEEEGAAAGRSTAWPAAPGTCYPPVFAQRVRRGSRMLSVGPWAFRTSGASCWGWQLLRGPVSWPLYLPLSAT